MTQLKQLYKNEKMIDALNGCLRAIQQSCLSAYEALDVPEYLAIAIKRSNQIQQENNVFTAECFNVQSDNDGGFEVTGSHSISD